MTQIGQEAFKGTLIEPQGVNAGAAVDAEVTLVPRTKAPVDPRHPQAGWDLPDKMVGLPEQLPGYPGQQRSIETG
jgi:hypothetical protein